MGNARSPLLRAAAALLLAVLVDGALAPNHAQPAAADAARFAPVGELAGACWEGPMPGEARDVHCYEWALGGAFLRDRHRVRGAQGEYAGEAIYGWDAAAGVLRYWYFNTLGGVSQGEVRHGETGWVFTETYQGGGAALEFRTTQTRPSADSYERATAQRRDGEWQDGPPLRFTRTRVTTALTGGAWSERWDLAYSTSRDGNYEVYRRDLRTGEERNLTSSPATEWAYTGGASLLLVSNRPAGSEPGHRLYRLAAAGGEALRLTDFVIADSWLGALPHEGGYVVCARIDGDQELLLLDDAGAVVRRLTDNEAQDCQPDVTPDGRTVVFWSDRGGSGELWSMPLAGGEARQLTHFAANDAVAAHLYGGEGPPRVSPDGTRILWMAMRGGEDWDVYSMALDGSDVRRLTDSLAHDGFPAWSPDGRFIAFDSDRAGGTDLYVMPAEGGAAVRVTDHPGSEQAPVWVPRP
jgi:TolB protein